MAPEKAKLDALKIDRSAKPERRGRSWLWVPLLFVVAVIVFWLFNRVEDFPTVTGANARAGSSSQDRTVLNASGYVTARRRATVSAKTTGKVLEVLIEEGMRVAKGQLLARLDDVNLRANLELAQARNRAAHSAQLETRVQMAEAERVVNRTRALFAKGVDTQANLDRDQAQVDMLTARLNRQVEDQEVTSREVVVWKRQLDDLEIRAPFSGVIVSKDAQPGEMISPVSAGGGFTRTGIGTVVDMNSLEIEVDVSESYINRVEAEQEVMATLDAYPDWQIPCFVIAIVPTADRQKATVRVRIGFKSSDPRTLPDMGVKVAFRDSQPGETVQGVYIPAQAVSKDGNQAVVFVLAGNKLERRAVSLGDRNANEVMIRSGLSAGERVMVTGPPNPEDGMQIKEVTP